jgi:glycosidase
MKKIIVFLLCAICAFDASAIRVKRSFKPSHQEQSQIFYEINIRQFSKAGTFDAVTKELPRLQKMGVKTIWLMPIFPIGKTNRKGGIGSHYSVQNYTQVNPDYGTLNDFKALVLKAHALKMNVILDWVANHTAWDHTWVTEHPDWYKKDSTDKMYSPFDWSDVVQLDHSNAEQADAMQNEMYYWVKECNIDGFRCDVADMLPVGFWINAREKCDGIKPLLWLTESENDNYFNAFDIQYSWKMLHALEDWKKGKTTAEHIDSIANWYLEDYKKGHLKMMLTSNHDENSWNGTEYERFGNSAKDMANLVMHLPGVQLIYNGQEEPLKKRLAFFEKDAIPFKSYKLSSFYRNTIKTRNQFYPEMNANAFQEVASIHFTENTTTLICDIVYNVKGKQVKKRVTVKK